MKKQSKTSLFGTIRKAFQMALAAEKQQTDSLEIVERDAEFRRSRRRFLENAGKTALLGSMMPKLLLPRSQGFFNRALMPRVAIVGGGIAGLNAMHTLRKHGLDATIYESSSRTGGRIFSVNGAMGDGTWTEFGGEFIDTDHLDMWRLMDEFDLKHLDCGRESETKLTKEAFFFDGQHHTLAQVVEAFRGFAPRLQADVEKLGDDFTYQTENPFVKKFDQISLSKYLEQIGASGWIKKLIEVAYESEYGLSTHDQSSLNLLLLISPETTDGKFEIFGKSDERYKVVGGNQRVPDALAQEYTNRIEVNRPLESIRAQGQQYALHFSGQSADVVADFVVLTIPFTILRHLDMQVDMPAVKRQSIQKLGYGTNAKLMLGMRTHVWRAQGYTGLCYSDNGIPNGWDNAQLQTDDNGTSGLSILFGGKSGVKLGHGTPEQQKDKYLPLWEKIFPGATKAFNGKVARMHWPSYPHALGSYVCPTRGQYTSIVGAEQMPVGNIFFAGEHCGGEFAGFMNGAAQSGREAGEAILAKVKG